MSATPPIPRDTDLYDEAGYLRLYPGIAEAIAAGMESSAWRHFDKHGRREGRRPNDVDAAFYLETYPQAAADIAAARAGDAAEHYFRFGRARGYLPNAATPRAAGAVMPPAFPFLWTDLPHAPELIEGRVELGRLAQRQASLLRSWVRNGFVVLERTIERDVLEAAALDLERGFAGASPHLLFACDALSAAPIHWRPELNPFPADSLDPHFMSRAIRDLAFAEPILEFLGLIFDARPLVAHSRGWLRDAPLRAQRDIAAAAFSLSRQCVSAWIPLEDGAGDPDMQFHFPASHRFPDLPANDLAERMTELGLAADPFVAAAGHAVIRHADLVHGGRPLRDLATRRGVLVQYCPSFVAPNYVETAPSRLWRQGTRLFLTQYYPDSEPHD
ncbi:MAG TPA: hypothetical protein VGG99_29720 [Acetobacteraceae bacterium]